jgi:hypothetical protein
MNTAMRRSLSNEQRKRQTRTSLYIYETVRETIRDSNLVAPKQKATVVNVAAVIE